MTSTSLEREKLELALAQAEAALKQLKTELANAVIALVSTVNDAARTDATDASTKVDNARARCRQLQAALDDPGHSERITRSRERLDTHISQSEIRTRREVAARESSRLSSEQAIRIETGESKGEPGSQKMTVRFKSALARLMRG